jgi:hypothetical protein
VHVSHALKSILLQNRMRTVINDGSRRALISVNAMILRRLGTKLRAETPCPSLDNCPDILEAADGSFLIIGEDVTDAARPHLSLGAGCGPTERIVRIPRETLLRAKKDIPSE